MLMEGDRFIMGEGRARLLRLIEEKGSISKAADEMDMSYRHAWGLVKDVEERCGDEVIRSTRGGDKKGGSTLTEEGRELLETYDSLKEQFDEEVYRKPSITVDGIIERGGEVVLIKRKNPPFKGKYALPGGFVDYGERVEEAVVREIEEETGLVTEVDRLIGVYSDPERDPRGHTISSVFSLKVKRGELEGDSDALEAEYFSLDDLPDLAFDHSKIMEDYISISSG